MEYPMLEVIPKTRTWVNLFKGYNHNLQIEEGELYDMKNLSSDNFPLLSPRKSRGVYASGISEKNACLIEKDNLCYVDGKNFVINKKAYDMGLSDEPKQLISMGAYVIIMPDKKYFNTEKDEDRGDIEKTFKTENSVTFTPSTLTGAAETYVPGSTAPPLTDDQKEGKDDIPKWLDTSTTPHSLKMYSISQQRWVSVVTTYVKITATGIGDNFEVGDGVFISGINEDELADLNNTAVVIQAKGKEYIIIQGLISKEKTQQSHPFKLERKIPKMDFVIECGNRLWGCFYGMKDGKAVNEIYCSKLGDFRNWYSFQGIATDSYSVGVGSDGVFTGAIAHLGYPLFFKENTLHKIYGNMPSNFQVQTTALRGVQKGCHRSLQILNETLYYKSRNGVCAYTGALPVDISPQLGEIAYSEASAGVLGNKYYISMSDNSEHTMFVYDSLKGLWHKEESVKATSFATARGVLYYVSDNSIIEAVAQDPDVRENIEWYAVTGLIGTDSPDKKYVSRIDVRMKLAIGASVRIFAEYDSSGEWEHLFMSEGYDLRSFSIPVKPKRCDHLRLKIAGKGDVKIFSICKTVEQGSNEG